ncbi:MAG: Transcriptional regulator, LacI family [Friedmanniella sp.]|nr:Transcriptional regulator, LacI family [Friedmanniella sp.]
MSRLAAAPTVHDVAQLAGVSAGTVSKALNGRGQLREETRKRVQVAAEQLGFRANRLAKGLIEGRTYTVGVLTSDSFGRFTMPLMNGIEDSLGAGSVSTLLCDSRGDPLRERHYLAELLGRRVDGIFVTGRRADPRPSLGPLPVPVVYAMSRSEDPLDLSIVYDDVQGAGLATSHLLAVGRKRIAYVSGPARHLSTRLRQEGTERTLLAAGLSLPPARVLLGEWSESWGRSAAHLLLGSAERVDGIVCGSDQIARGVADELREAGVDVPGEVSLVGFDNWDVMVEASRPQLTTVEPNLKKLGQLAANRLLHAIDGGELGSGLVLLPCDLVLRQSSMPSGP